VVSPFLSLFSGGGCLIRAVAETAAWALVPRDLDVLVDLVF
jgi:hypothetical protein